MNKFDIFILQIIVSDFCQCILQIVLQDFVGLSVALLWVIFSQNKKATFLPEYLHFNEDPVVNQSKTDQMETIINTSDLKSKLLMISYDWMGVSMFATIMTRGQHINHSFCLFLISIGYQFNWFPVSVGFWLLIVSGFYWFAISIGSWFLIVSGKE